MLQTHIIDHNNAEVKRILTEDPTLALETFGYHSYSLPLQTAIRAGNIEAAAIIMSFGNNNILERRFYKNFTVYEFSALEEACLVSNEEMLHLILSMYPGDEKSLAKEIQNSDLFDNLFFQQLESLYKIIEKKSIFKKYIFPRFFQKDARKIVDFIYDNINTPLLLFLLEFLSPYQVQHLYSIFDTHEIWAFLVLKQKRAEERIGSIFAKHLTDLPAELSSQISSYFNVDMKFF